MDSERAGVYAVTGSASGMGSATAARLRAEAIRRVLEAADGRLDGVVVAAGLGPSGGADRLRRIAEVNVLGAVDLLEGWRPALAGTKRGKAVVIASNSTTTTPVVPRRTVQALMSGDIDKAVRTVRMFGPARPAIMYAASKIAVSRWVRRQAIRPEWAGAGIRLNAPAPGAVMTPLLEERLASPAQSKAVRRFPVPVGGFGDPEHLAAWVCFMLSDAAEFLCGSMIFVGGGTDAHFRADDWPRPVPARQLVTYLRRFLGRGR